MHVCACVMIPYEPLFVKYGLCMCGVVVLGHLSLLPTVFLFVKYGFCMCGVVYSIGTLC